MLYPKNQSGDMNKVAIYRTSDLPFIKLLQVKCRAYLQILLINNSALLLMMGFYDNGWFGMGWFGWTIMILFWIAVVWLIVWLMSQNQSGREHTTDPRTKLKLRYVNGEITAKEYEEMKKRLTE